MKMIVEETTEVVADGVVVAEVDEEAVGAVEVVVAVVEDMQDVEDTDEARLEDGVEVTYINGD